MREAVTLVSLTEFIGSNPVVPIVTNIITGLKLEST